MNKNDRKKEFHTGKVNPNSIKEFKVHEDCELLEFCYPNIQNYREMR